MITRVTAPDGVEIACEISGEGPPLVVVHGAGSARWGFAALRPHLAAEFTVIAIDRRGRGDSTDGDGYALELELDDLVAVMEAAPTLAPERTQGRAGPAFLFGHSYGALLAAHAAPRLRTLPKLALYEPPMGGVLAAPDRVERWERLLAGGERDRLVREFLHDVGGYSEQEIDGFAATEAWEPRKAVAHTVPRELRAEHGFRLENAALARLRRPVLMLLGSASPSWAVRSTEAYASAMSRAHVRELRGQGHGASLAAPELVAAELRAFLVD